MRWVNIPSGAQRNAETGLVWKEIYNGAAGITFTCLQQATFRVSAAADVTVTIGGVLAMTMRAGEVERFNAGVGLEGDNRASVTVVIGAGDARVQLALDSDAAARRNK